MAGIKQEKKRRGIFYILLSMLLSLCVIRYTFQINIPLGVLVGIAILGMFLGDQDEIMAMSMCCIPLHTSFQSVYAVLSGVVFFAFRYRKKIRLNMAIIPMMMMILWETVHCFGQKFGIVQFAGDCLPFLLLAVLVCFDAVEFDYDFISRAFAISVAVMCVSLIGKLLYVAEFDAAVALSNLQRLGLDSEEAEKSLQVVGAEQNPNTLGIMCVMGVTGLLQLRTARRENKWDVPLMIFLLVFGAMTASRTFLVCLVSMALLMMFSQQGSVNKKVRFLAGTVLAMTMAAFLLYLFAPAMMEYFIGRFQVDDLTTGRLDLMELYHEFLMSNGKVLFYGIGLHDFGIKVTEGFRVADNVPHNAIQELIIAWGIPGALLFVVFMLVTLRRSKQINRGQKLINFIPLLIILIKIQAGQMLTSSYTMLALSLAYLSLCADLRPGEEYRVQIDEGFSAMEDANGIEFGHALSDLWKKRFMIIAVSMAGAIVAYGVSRYAVTPMYQSSALLYVNNKNMNMAANKVIASITENDLWASRRLVNTYEVILRANETLNQVIEHAGVDRTCDELKEMIVSTQVDETEVFEVVVTSEDPSEAERIANSITAILPQRIAEIIHDSSVKVVDYAVVASGPSFPNNISNAMIGFIFGFVLIVMILLWKMISGTTIRMEEDVIRMAGYPMLATIPDLMREEQSIRKR